MGQCCLKLLCINTSTHEHNTNLSLLEHRIKVKQATANDEQFTYFKGIGELDRFIDDVLNKENMEDKEKNKKILAEEISKLERYLAEVNDQSSPLRRKIDEDNNRITIKEQPTTKFCLVKLEIQSFEPLSPEIDKLNFECPKSNPPSSQTYPLSYLSTIPSPYFELFLPLPLLVKSSNPQLIFSTSSLFTTLTLELDDIITTDCLLSVFHLRTRIYHRETAYIALRIQCITYNSVLLRCQELELLLKVLKNTYEKSLEWGELRSSFSEARERISRSSISSWNDYRNEYLLEKGEYK